MQVKKFIVKTTIIILVMALPIILLVTTNGGLNVALRVASCFSPVVVDFDRAEGKIIGQPISVLGVVIKDKGHTLKIAKLDLDWQLKTFTAYKITGFEHFLPQSELLVSNDNSTAIEQVHGKLSSVSKEQHLAINAVGVWQKEPLDATISASTSNDAWQLDSAKVNIGHNILSINIKQNNSYAWKLSITQPQIIFKQGYGKLYAAGNLNKIDSSPELTATVSASSFGLQGYELKNFNLTATPLSIIAKADKITLNNEPLTNFRLNIVGNLAKHSMSSSLKYKDHILQITARGELSNHVWQSNDLTFKQQDEILSGSAMFNFKMSTGRINLAGKLLGASTTLKLKSEDKKKNLLLHMQTVEANHLKADLSLNDKNLSGSINIKAEDLSLVMKFIPELTRLKGVLNAQAKISGTLDNPIVKTDANVTDITATFPGMGVKIKPMELHIIGNENGKFILSGKAKMRRGTGDFVIKGFIEPFKADMPNELHIIGTNVEFINNEHAHLTAANDLKFYYDNKANRLDISGYVEIQKGNIYFDVNKSSTVKSKDVVFVDRKVESKNEMIINPNINLRILEQVHFSGFNLDADISGKLDIVQRNDAMYATGRVTIKQGTYMLPGQKLEINRGRLLFPPGTLLVNPALDIKMHGTKKDDIEIAVQGTAQKPMLRESGISDNSDKAISQALTTGSGMLTKGFMGGKFKMPELSLSSRDDHTLNFFDDRGKHKSSLANKDLVVGMPLGKKLHVEYLQGLSTLDKYSTSTSKRVRLKYDLHKNWAIGVESGDQGGGADLIFSFEK